MKIVEKFCDIVMAILRMNLYWNSGCKLPGRHFWTKQILVVYVGKTLKKYNTSENLLPVISFIRAILASKLVFGSSKWAIRILTQYSLYWK